MSIAIGIDVGGSGIKGNCVDLEKGQLVCDRIRIPTPKPATPDSVIDTIAKIVSQCACGGPIGCAFPAVVNEGVVFNATNIDDSWINLDAGKAIARRLDQPVSLINDGDAAGIAEMRYGVGVPFQDSGVVVMLVFGTGIGSSVFVNGNILPNTEFGELEIDGRIAEQFAAARFVENGSVSWEEWIPLVQSYLTHIDRLLTPDLIIFGGGVTKDHDKFMPHLSTRAQLKTASLLGNAGIVGAALATSRSA